MRMLTAGVLESDGAGSVLPPGRNAPTELLFFRNRPIVEPIF